MSIAKAGLQLFFREQLGHRDWKVFAELVIRRNVPLPLVLSREEVRRTLDGLREERFRVCLRLIYHGGLRVGRRACEAVKIKVTDIDAAQGRLLVREGKGGKDRGVPLTARMISELRAFWKTHRNPVWLFPAPGRAWRERKEDRDAVLGRATTFMSVSAVQNAFRLARAESGIHPEGVRPHVAALLRDASAGGRRFAAAHLPIPRARLARCHGHLHAPDGHQRRPGPRRPRPVDAVKFKV